MTKQREESVPKKILVTYEAIVDLTDTLLYHDP